MSDLIDAGVSKMRLPQWAVGYAVPREAGPWVDIYDVNAGIGSGAPIAILIGVCDQDDRWEPFDGEHTGRGQGGENA